MLCEENSQSTEWKSVCMYILSTAYAGGPVFPSSSWADSNLGDVSREYIDRAVSEGTKAIAAQVAPRCRFSSLVENEKAIPNRNPIRGITADKTYISILTESPSRSTGGA